MVFVQTTILAYCVCCGEGCSEKHEKWSDNSAAAMTMVTNLLFDYGGDKDPDEWDYQAMEQAINAEIQSLIAACQRCPAKVVLVTNEVGMGIVPESRLARHFRDIAGRVNQQLAAAANEVWLVVSGIGVKIK